MSYLHCHTKGCGWSQDDFWNESKDYPLDDDYVKYLLNLRFRDKIYLDKYMCLENPTLRYSQDDKGYWVKGTDLLAFELRKIAKQVENMSVKTWEDWEKVKDTWKCPKCGQQNPDID